jgi:hypothetical protein
MADKKTRQSFKQQKKTRSKPLLTDLSFVALIGNTQSRSELNKMGYARAFC